MRALGVATVLAAASAPALARTVGERVAPSAATSAPVVIAAGAPLPAALADRARQVVQAAAVLEAARRSARPAHTAGAPRIEVELGTLDPRLRLAACGRVDVVMPAGSAAWGRSRVSLRCVDGTTRWSVTLPVTVRVFDQAVVARTALAAGHVLAAGDLGLAVVDVAGGTSPVGADPGEWVGRTLARPAQAGQAVRRADLQARRYFDAGETVRVTARGHGFAVQGSGQALNPGIEGQVARIRTDNGRILSATPVAEREVEITL